MTTASTGRPAVIMIVEGRVPPGGRDALEQFSADAEDYFAEQGSSSARLQWDDADPERFRAVFEYPSEDAFELYDVRTRTDARFMALRSRFVSHLAGAPLVSGWRETARQYCADLVRAYWGLLDAREWTGLRAILADDVVFEWPAFNERVLGADAVIAAGQHTPKEWVVRVGSVLACGEKAASHVTIVLEDGQEIVLSTFWEVRHQRIVRATEFWSAVGRDSRPGWRSAWSMPMG